MSNLKLSPALFVLLFVVFRLSSFSQQSKADSLRKIVLSGINDTGKVNALNELSGLLGWQIGNYDTGKYYAGEAGKLAEKLSFKKGIASSHSNIGVINNGLGNYSEALKEHTIALEIRKQIQFKKGISASYNNIGITNYNLGNYSEALQNYFASLKINLETGHKQAISLCYNNIGNVYSDMGNYQEALKYHSSSLKVGIETQDASSIANSYNNLGVVYFKQSNYQEALNYFLKALKMKEEIGDKQGIINAYSNIGTVYYNLRNYDKALENHFISLKMMEEIGDKKGIANASSNIGNIYTITGRAKEGKDWQERALEQAKIIGAKDIIKNCYSGLMEADSILGNCNEASQSLKMFIIYRDSLFNEENVKKTVQLQMQSDFDIKDAKTKAEQEKKDAIALAEKRRQQLFLLLAGAIAIAVIIIAVLIFRSLRIARKQKQIIETQKSITEKQNLIIERKNRSITDSINYAKTIQKAMLPHRKDIWAAFENSFVLYKPKDIVSGDFYFFSSITDSNHLIGAADCTGHGVPGGFMTMLSAERLTEATKHEKEPAKILSILNRGIKKSLKQTSDRNSSKDGLDIALCAVDTVNRTILYAGANRPLWIVRKDGTEIEVIKATKRGIGGITADEQIFEQHTVSLQKGDTFYIFSDGYVDLYNKNEQKLMSRGFKQLLLEIHQKSMKDQWIYLDEFAEKWKAGTEQIDDILVIGVRL